MSTKTIVHPHVQTDATPDDFEVEQAIDKANRRYAAHMESLVSAAQEQLSQLHALGATSTPKSKMRLTPAEGGAVELAAMNRFRTEWSHRTARIIALSAYLLVAGTIIAIPPAGVPLTELLAWLGVKAVIAVIVGFCVMKPLAALLQKMWKPGWVTVTLHPDMIGAPRLRQRSVMLLGMLPTDALAWQTPEFEAGLPEIFYVMSQHPLAAHT